MAKLELILDYAENHTADITASTDAWTEMLDTAAQLYRYSFSDLVLIHAQRPDATALQRIMCRPRIQRAAIPSPRAWTSWRTDRVMPTRPWTGPMFSWSRKAPSTAEERLQRRIRRFSCTRMGSRSSWAV